MLNIEVESTKGIWTSQIWQFFPEINIEYITQDLLPAAQLKLLNNVADFLKSVGITLFFTLIVRNHLQKRAMPFQSMPHCHITLYYSSSHYIHQSFSHPDFQGRVGNWLYCLYWSVPYSISILNKFNIPKDDPSSNVWL